MNLHQVSLRIQPVLTLSIPGLLDAIGLFTDEELVRTELGQPSKLRFSEQRRELKWLMLKNEEDCSIRHVWNFPFVNMSAIWCLESMYLIWILESRLIQSNSVGSWHMSYCGTSAFDYHLNHSFSVLKHVQHSIGLRKFHIQKHIVNVKQIRTVVRGWSFGLILVRFAWRGSMQQVHLCQWINGFIGLV